MISVLVSLLQTLRGLAQSRAALHLEVLALRHQLQVLQRARPRRVRLATADRWLWVWLARVWTAWRTALVIVKPETVIAWHRYAFRLVWTCKSRRRTGRPAVPQDVRTLIRTMSRANPFVGRASDSRRTVEAWDCRLSGNRREIHGARPAAALPDLASQRCGSIERILAGIERSRESRSCWHCWFPQLLFCCCSLGAGKQRLHPAAAPRSCGVRVKACGRRG
jgi:hypothetical protein